MKLGPYISSRKDSCANPFKAATPQRDLSFLTLVGGSLHTGVMPDHRLSPGSH